MKERPTGMPMHLAHGYGEVRIAGDGGELAGGAAEGLSLRIGSISQAGRAGGGDQGVAARLASACVDAVRAAQAPRGRLARPGRRDRRGRLVFSAARKMSWPNRGISARGVSFVEGDEVGQGAGLHPRRRGAGEIGVHPDLEFGEQDRLLGGVQRPCRRARWRSRRGSRRPRASAPARRRTPRRSPGGSRRRSAARRSARPSATVIERRIVACGVGLGRRSSAGSTPAMTDSSSAASRTLAAIGPAVSWLALIGTMPVRGDETDRGFQADDAVDRSWAGDRAIGLGADRHPHVARGDGGGAAGGGAARVCAAGSCGLRALAADGAPAADRVVGAEVGPLREVGLAEDDEAGGAQPRDERRVPRG